MGQLRPSRITKPKASRLMPSINSQFPSKYLKGDQDILNEETAVLTVREWTRD